MKLKWRDRKWRRLAKPVKKMREELHCTTAQVNNARTSGDHIFGEYKVEEIDRKLSRKTDFDLLREFESVCDQLLGSRKGKK